MDLLKRNVFLSSLLSLCGFLFPLVALSYYDIYSLDKIPGYVILAILILSFSKMFESKWIEGFIITIGSAFFAIFVYIEVAYLYIFGHYLTQNAIPIFLETTYNETSNFLSSYMNFNLIALGILFIISLIGSIVWRLKFFVPQTNYSYSKYIIKLNIFMTLTLFVVKDQLLPYVVMKSAYKYNRERNKLKKISIEKNGYFQNVSSKNKDEELGVVIIGESTSKWNMGLYNYYRQTNPLLERIKRDGNLFIYDDVITSHTHTIPSLKKALTFGYENNNLRYNHSIIQLLNSAGFKTFWISNQDPIGIYDTSTRFISKTSDVSIFTGKSEEQLDIETINPLRNVLQDKAKKKFIFIHLIGCHSKYERRYPEKYDVYKSIPKTNYPSSEAITTINQYDNCILYNDFIVNSILSEVEKSNKKAFVIYFSDHGDDVFQTQDGYGHDESVGSKPMFEIPFLVWFSRDFDKSKFAFDSKRRYITSDLVHTITDLTQINVVQYDSTKSIFNECYEDKKRIILGNKVYEEYFKK